MSNFVSSAGSVYNRQKEVKKFDESKIGVKGLFDAGIQTIPRFFHHPPSSLNHTHVRAGASIPVVDLSLQHSRAVASATAAAKEWGFFQLVNHGIPAASMSAAIAAVQAFNELPTEVKSAHYTREKFSGFAFNTNYDLYRSNAATWRDSLQIKTGPTAADPSWIPEICRSDLLKWDGHSRALAARTLELLCEGIGEAPGRLEGLSILEGRHMSCDYYPYCPEPHLTFGIARHTDVSALTVLIQNKVPGLQVRMPGDDDAWVDVDPIPGAIVINIGDTLQMMSNDEYKSLEHKVAANTNQKPRVSVATFYNPCGTHKTARYGPLPELISPERPAK